MSNIVDIRSFSRPPRSAVGLNCSAAGEIILFTGIRYERPMVTNAQKRRRRAKRDRIELEG